MPNGSTLERNCAPTAGCIGAQVIPGHAQRVQVFLSRTWAKVVLGNRKAVFQVSKAGTSEAPVPVPGRMRH